MNSFAYILFTILMLFIIKGDNKTTSNDQRILQGESYSLSEFSTLRDTIEVMGIPNEIKIYSLNYGELISLYYITGMIRIDLTTNMVVLPENPWRICPNLSFIDAFFIYDIQPYRSLIALKNDISPENTLSGERIPSAVWKPWLENNDEIYCTTALQEIWEAIYPENKYEYSLFIEDTCDRVCWFSLRSGLSDTNSVERMLYSRFPVIYGYVSRQPTVSEFNEIGLLVNGQYELYFRYYERQDVPQAPSLLLIENGKVQQMQIQMNRIMSLDGVLGQLGVPEQVYLQRAQNDQFILSLGYQRNRQRVDLITNENQCLQTTLGQAFQVDMSIYFGLDTPIMPEISSETSDGNNFVRAVPIDLWRPWFEENAPISCEAAIQEVMD
jgi:hypothetical protein